jgi:hypothetical protein
MLQRDVWWKITDVSEVLAASIIRAAHPIGSHLHSRRCDNLKSHLVYTVSKCVLADF